ncbi:MAG TPA: Hsp20/alpha crystallin family protein [Candidatus Mediterraneibacter pullistercoris]|nr:Hsp20/alpha crystallin family protein [Candidatus Mediterraneibacter pullistercoris]
MLMPSIFGENLFDDDWMKFPFDRDFWGRSNPSYTRTGKNLMKTDIREHDAGYELDIDLPGFKKDEIRAELENGYLTISATKGTSSDEQDKQGKYIRRERYAGTMQRSFYVGGDVTQEDIRAKFEDGILKLSIPKKEAKAVETKKSIAIEG